MLSMLRKLHASTVVSENQLKRRKDLLHQLIYKKLLEKGFAKLAKDECYPEDMRMEFEAYSVGKLDDYLQEY